MAMSLTILYRGAISSCNYECSYCPFAKPDDRFEEFAQDQADLERFVRWVESQPGLALSVFFTPRGEALIHDWYQQAIGRLSHLPHVRKVAIQTNLSGRLSWLDNCRLERIGLWCSYHPSQVSRPTFVEQCRRLSNLGVRYSVGVVGIKEHLDEIEHLRGELDRSVYLWINAYKRRAGYYRPEEIHRLVRVDPLFPFSMHAHISLGQPCHCGKTVISVDGDGLIRRCHFIPEPIGNLYEDHLAKFLSKRGCTNPTCGCHIGYVHLQSLHLADVFGEGILERIPRDYDSLRNVDPYTCQT